MRLKNKVIGLLMLGTSLALANGSGQVTINPPVNPPAPGGAAHALLWADTEIGGGKPLDPKHVRTSPNTPPPSASQVLQFNHVVTGMGADTSNWVEEVVQLSDFPSCYAGIVATVNVGYSTKYNITTDVQSNAKFEGNTCTINGTQYILCTPKLSASGDKINLTVTLILTPDPSACSWVTLSK